MLKSPLFSFMLGLMLLVVMPLSAERVWISCNVAQGFVGLGEFHDAEAQIFYVINSSEPTEDGL